VRGNGCPELEVGSAWHWVRLSAPSIAGVAPLQPQRILLQLAAVGPRQGGEPGARGENPNAERLLQHGQIGVAGDDGFGACGQARAALEKGVR